LRRFDDPGKPLAERTLTIANLAKPVFDADDDNMP
jgi:hypothetical protein